jgi:UDP-N-acetylmuramoyl-tripeptide--D-alanyl-D-alanine ligase
VLGDGIWQVIGPRVSYPKTLVLEVGADRPGDIARIAKWLRPHVVVITRLPEIPVHIEFFPSVEMLREEKFSLAKYMRRDGTLVLNADDERVMEAKNRFHMRTLTYGTSPEAMLRASNIQMLAPGQASTHGGIAYKLDFDGKSLPVVLSGVYAESFVSVSLAALAASAAVGANLVHAIDALREYEVPPGRVRPILGFGDTTLIDDTYNSSPAACEAGLLMLRDIPFGSRKIAVLGDMLELGQTDQ